MADFANELLGDDSDSDDDDDSDGDSDGGGGGEARAGAGAGAGDGDGDAGVAVDAVEHDPVERWLQQQRKALREEGVALDSPRDEPAPKRAKQ